MMVIEGNAAESGSGQRGWFLGHFAPDGPFRSEDIEIKWGTHEAGEERSEWASSEHARSISMLIRGRFLLMFEDRECLLQREGDFVYWGPGERHTWRAEADSVVLTVRWPSVRGDRE